MFHSSAAFIIISGTAREMGGTCSTHAASCGRWSDMSQARLQVLPRHERLPPRDVGGGRASAACVQAARTVWYEPRQRHMYHDACCCTPRPPPLSIRAGDAPSFLLAHHCCCLPQRERGLVELALFGRQRLRVKALLGEVRHAHIAPAKVAPLQPCTHAARWCRWRTDTQSGRDRIGSEWLASVMRHRPGVCVGGGARARPHLKVDLRLGR